MTRNLRTLALSLVALVIVALPATSLAERRSHSTQVSAQSVGSVASFAEGVLAIEVADGSRISGAIVPRTRLGCARSVRGKRIYGFRAMAITAAASRTARPAGATGPVGAPERGVGHGRRTCDVAALKVGTKVLAADMTLTENGPVWRLVIFLTPPVEPAGPTGPTGTQTA